LLRRAEIQRCLEEELQREFGSLLTLDDLERECEGACQWVLLLRCLNLHSQLRCISATNDAIQRCWMRIAADEVRTERDAMRGLAEIREIVR
jgi:hypothetical protein